MHTHITESLIQRINRVSKKLPHITAQMYKDANNEYLSCSYEELAQNFMKFAHFLKHTCKVSPFDHIAILSDNRYEWVPIDLAMMCIKAVSVPRGSDTKAEEIAYILTHSESRGCIFENYSSFKALSEKFPKIIKKLKFIIFIEHTEISNSLLPKHTYYYHQIIAQDISKEEIKEIQTNIAHTNPKDLTTIIYTSGTTAEPKGVCLTQGNFEVQIDKILPYIPLKIGNIFLSILPVWHAYAREMQYVVLGVGATIAYSKPIGTILLEDLKKSQSSFLTSVPRIWEGVHSAIYRNIKKESNIKKSIFKLAVSVGKTQEFLKNTITDNIPRYKFHIRALDIFAIIPYLCLIPLRTLLDILVFKKIRKLLGKNFIAGISGGGSLAPHIDKFFAAARIPILEGYGLTETAPVLSVRKLKNPEINSVGKLFPEIEYKILKEDKSPAKIGEQGILYVRTNQLMQGYYKNEKATRAVLSEDGWFNTGDLVRESYNSCIQILGRAKDTIVLSNGENIEPDYVEQILKQSEFIEQVMIVGQDQKFISALIVPNQDELISYAKTQHLSTNIKELCKNSQIIEHYQTILTTFKNQLNNFETINKFILLPKEFEVGHELTQTLKLKRSTIQEKYKKEIASLYQY